MAYADSIRTTDYTREELADLIDGNRFINEAVLTAGTQPNYTVTLTPAPAAYYDGMSFTIVIHSTLISTGATLNVNGLGAKDLKITTAGSGRRDPIIGELSAGEAYVVTYISSANSFQIANPTFGYQTTAYTPSVSSPSGTIGVGGSLDNWWQYIGPTTIRVHWQLQLGLSGSTAQYLTVSLPATPAAHDDNTFGVGYTTGVSGYTSYGAKVFIVGSNARFVRTDQANWAIDANFFIYGTLIYDEAV